MTLTILESISNAGKANYSNEDLLLVDDNLALIFDGASGLSKNRLGADGSDAHWFVNQLSEKLRENWRRTHNFSSSLNDAFKRTFDCFLSLSANQRLLPYEYPSSGMIAIAVEHNVPCLYRLGDCNAFHVEQDISPVFPISELERLDERSIAEMLGYLNDNNQAEEARTKLIPTLQKHRNLINTPQGYQALSLGSEKIGKMERQRIRKSTNKTQYLLASDGFYALFKQYYTDERYKAFSKGSFSLSKAIDVLRSIENDDPNMKRFPRLKPHDDATAVLVELKFNS
jgi:serine/threonine protein phosphatase PrpC